MNDLEAEGGEDNLMKISLRSLDMASISYHDYLQLGLNSVSITMTPMGGDCIYQMRAVSIRLE